MKDDLVYPQHIRDAIDRIAEYVGEDREAFLADRKTQDAVVRNLQIIEDASKRISEEFKSEHGGIPWRQMAGTRDRIVHEYMGVSYRLVWDIVAHELPEVRLEIEVILRTGNL